MKRLNGEGSIYRKGDGYEVALLVDGRRRTARAKTAAEARTKLLELQNKRDAGLFVADDRLTVGDYLEYWLTVVETTVRPRTAKRYAEYVRVHAVPIIGRHRLVDLKPTHLQRLYAARLEAGSSPSTVQHRHRVLHHAFVMAERWELARRNVAKHATPPRVPRYKIRPLTARDVRQLLAAAEGEHFEAAVVLAIVSGLRLGEIFALRWTDVDLGENAVVHVRGSLQRVDGRLTIVEPKTDESMRDVAIGRLGAEALRRHRVRQNQERLRLGEAWEDMDLVFPNGRGRYMATDYFVRRHFQRMLLAAGLPRIRFHDLRHTFATLQLSNKQPVKVVSEMMGHTRTAITQDLYTHVSAQMQRQAASALDVLLSADADDDLDPVAGSVAGGSQSEGSATSAS